MKRLLNLLIIFILILTISGCTSVYSVREKLPTVGELTPPNLPEWIEEISPVGNADTLSQIRIRFKSPLIPVESLDSPQQRSLLNKFEIWPP